MNETNSARIIAAAPSVFVRGDGRDPFALFGFECGDGWADLLVRCATKLEAVNATREPDAKVTAAQVKEKFGGLRFYLDGPEDDATQSAIDAAEIEAWRTCEACGADGKLRGRGWFSVRCDACAKPSRGCGVHDGRKPGCGECNA